MRREADNIGPRFELDHWMKRLVKFHYLLDQLKSRTVRHVILVLQAAKSKTLKVFSADFRVIVLTLLHIIFDRR